ncbi:hypothetical protein QGM61_01865 [Pseudohongiella sp. SYSU M77423]|uniref:hypothetical protein n=1 Tax=Pseudohongiella sp. SYSU M77423 TaxID=3042312 RepID=UPI002480459C|nr:hypothetical protein [Pseudohongiella sp. SYSU M77423]MDH7942554.1 hypothetical protein [Pseudohongiella sp. SYSU M77423]
MPTSNQIAPNDMFEERTEAVPPQRAADTQLSGQRSQLPLSTENAAGPETAQRYVPPDADSNTNEVDMTPASGSRATDAQSASAIETGRERAEMLRAVQSNLNEMLMSRQQIDVNDLDSILGRLESLQGPDGTVGGLRVSALRENLNAANEMMRLVERINTAAQAGADQQTMQSYVDQLQALQQRMQAGSQGLVVPGANLPQGAGQ